MEKLWTQAKRLEGRTLYTQTRRRPFKVASVTDAHLTIEHGTRGNTRSYERGAIEAACRVGLSGGKLSAEALRATGVTDRSESDLTYLPVITRALLESARLGRPAPRTRGTGAEGTTAVLELDAA